jgi:hypothetical protein
MVRKLTPKRDATCHRTSANSKLDVRSKSRNLITGFGLIFVGIEAWDDLLWGVEVLLPLRAEVSAVQLGIALG